MKEILLKSILIVFSFAMASCSNQNAKTENSNRGISETIDADAFEQKLKDTAVVQLIDVRTPEEFSEGHLPFAKNINYNSDSFEQEIKKLDPNSPVLVYCMSGGRSSSAASKLEEMGFTYIYNLKGGILAWSGAGKKISNVNESKSTAQLSTSDFDKLVHSEKHVLIDYNAKWCEPCKKIAPILDSLAEAKMGAFKLIKIDADANKNLMRQRGIMNIPYLEYFENGILIWKHEGTIDAATLTKEIKI